MSHSQRSHSKKEINKRSQYWYKTIINDCTECGWGEVVRVRVYGSKPKRHIKRKTYQSKICYDCWKKDFQDF